MNLSPNQMNENFHRNDEVAKEMGYKRHWYLESIGFPIKDCYNNLLVGEHDKREPEWTSEQIKFGFDNRETWALNNTFFQWLYERLCMYRDVTIIDTSYHTIRVGKKTYTQGEAIEEMIDKLEYILLHEDDDPKYSKYTDKVLKIWAAVFPCMWW